MRALVVTIWIFINLVFLGMCGYMYLLWSQYWMYIERETQTTTYNYDQQIYYYNRGYPAAIPNETKQNATSARGRTKHSVKENGTFTLIKNSKPRFPNLESKEFKMNNSQYKCVDHESTSECDKKISDYKDKILKELRRVFIDESDVYKSGTETNNPYNVQYKGRKIDHMNKLPHSILCQMKNVHLKTLNRGDPFPSGSVLKEYLPKRGIFENKHFNTCAVISSAGSLKNSELGTLIDSHDIVLRFNHAPTNGFQRDVGEKTTVRILNSQVVSKQEFRFLQSNLYRNITLIAWDPSNYTASLEEWYQHPEFNLFPNYIEYRKRFPKSRFFIMNPQSLWELWNFLQSNSPNRLRRNPPSSGFLGLAVLLPHCSYIDMFEYMPSTRITKRCHYYDPEDNPACTFGVWHPLAAEKLLAYFLNIATDRSVFQTGFVRIPGLKNIPC